MTKIGILLFFWLFALLCVCAPTYFWHQYLLIAGVFVEAQNQ